MLATRACRVYVASSGVVLGLAAVAIVAASAFTVGGDIDHTKLALAAPPRTVSRVATNKGNLKIFPIRHATFAMEWNRRSIYVDPVGGKGKFRGLEPPHIILITDIHGDHLDIATVMAVKLPATIIVAPPAAAEKLKEEGIKASRLIVLKNGEAKIVRAIPIKAVPMYNLTPERQRFHSKGRGNGYTLDFGGTRVYISGDTEDIPEMRKLSRIDVAFLCMNLPYTMTAEQAASAALEFKPGVVYPYHYRGAGENGTQDPKKFKTLVTEESKDIEVRLLDWYPGEG